MILRSPIFAAALAFAGCISLLGQGDAVRVLASNGMKAVIEELQPQCERAIGHPLAIEFGSTSELKGKIEAGAPFDVAILTSDAIADLAKENRIASGTQTAFARSGVGVAVRAGAPKPDIGAPEALKRTLLAATSITFARDGATRASLEKMFERLGIAGELAPKLRLTQGSGLAMAGVASGQAAIGLTLMSEMLPVRGLDIVGPLPPDLQIYIEFGAGAGVHAEHAEAARALLASLKTLAAAPVYKAKGMEPR